MIKREELGKENVTEGSNEVGSSEFHRAESVLAEGFPRDLLQGRMTCFAHRSERPALSTLKEILMDTGQVVNGDAQEWPPNWD